MLAIADLSDGSLRACRRPTLGDWVRSCCYSCLMHCCCAIHFHCVSLLHSIHLTGSLKTLAYHCPTHGQLVRYCSDRFRGSKNRRANPNHSPPPVWTCVRPSPLRRVQTVAWCNRK